MCLPLCSVCGRPLLTGERAVQLSRGVIDIGQQFEAEESEVIHEDCLADVE